MPSFLPHLLIPLLVALAFLPAERRKIVLMAPIAWFPDVDYAVQSIHRAATHSLFLPLALAVAAVVLWRRRAPEAEFLEFAMRPGAPSTLGLGAYYLASHDLMDIFQGGVVLFWPLSTTNFYYAFQIILDTGSNTFEPQSAAGTSEGAPALSPRYAWVSTLDTAIAAFLAACGAAWVALRRRRPVIVHRTARLLPDEPASQKK